jgi:acetone monooxygenase
MWLASFPEMFFDEQVNEVVSEFVRIKMRERLRSKPDLCNLLIPTDYGFGTHRVPLENKYLEVYLQPNVEAVDCKQSPIERIVPEGIQTADGKIHEVDIIVLAVGFDAGSGALSRIDIRGRDSRSLKEQWKQEIRTSMGLQIHGYPNLFTTGAPLAPSAALCNMTTCSSRWTGSLDVLSLPPGTVNKSWKPPKSSRTTGYSITTRRRRRPWSSKPTLGTWAPT